MEISNLHIFLEDNPFNAEALEQLKEARLDLQRMIDLEQETDLKEVECKDPKGIILLK